MPDPGFADDRTSSALMKITFRCDPALVDLLPRPVLARAELPDWLRAMAPRVASPVHGRAIRTVKQCPPFVDAMRHGFMLVLPCDVTVEAGLKFGWDWVLPELTVPGHPRAPLSFHVPEQVAGSPLAHGAQSALKFNSFWTIELEDGWSLLAMHPFNRDDLPFRTVTGLVDADRFNDVGINFPAVWLDPGFVGVLPKGLPIAQCCVVPRAAPELLFEAMSEERVAGYSSVADKIMSGPGVYRKGYRSKR
jgi:hypothetical protein